LQTTAEFAFFQYMHNLIWLGAQEPALGDTTAEQAILLNRITARPSPSVFVDRWQTDRIAQVTSELYSVLDAFNVYKINQDRSVSFPTVAAAFPQ